MIVSVSERKNRTQRKEQEIMRNTKWIKGMAVALCLVSMTGCGAAETPGTDSGNVPVVEENQQAGNNGETSTEDTSDTTNLNALLDSAVLKGTVTEFSDGVFQVLPMIEKDGGQTAMEAAPGQEEGMEQITVRYEESCQFQIAEINASTGAAQFVESNAAEVKKQTSIAVFGEKQESGEILATRILITRYSNATGVAG